MSDRNALAGLSLEERAKAVRGRARVASDHALTIDSGEELNAEGAADGAPRSESGGATGGGRAELSRPRTQREIQMPESIAAMVDATGVHPADVIERAWRRQGTPAGIGRLVRSAERGRRKFRVRLPDDVFEAMRVQANRLGWSISALAAAAVMADLSE